MKILSVICSYNTKKMTETIYNELKAISGHDVMVLENSTTEDQIFQSPDTVDLGRVNVGFGGFRDYIFSEDLFRRYDFVGVWNNDVHDVPKDYIEKISQYMADDTGIISSAINDDGTGWKHMRKIGEGAREVEHVEDMAAYFNTKLFPVVQSYCPFPYWGVLDIILSSIYKKNWYELLICDDVTVIHDLSGARKEIGTVEEYLKKFPAELTGWLDKYPEIKQMYGDYLKSVSERNRPKL